MNDAYFPHYICCFAQRFPRLTNVVIGALLVLVVVVELMSTEAPIVLYQAF